MYHKLWVSHLFVDALDSIDTSNVYQMSYWEFYFMLGRVFLLHHAGSDIHRFQQYTRLLKKYQTHNIIECSRTILQVRDELHMRSTVWTGCVRTETLLRSAVASQHPETGGWTHRPTGPFHYRITGPNGYVEGKNTNIFICVIGWIACIGLIFFSGKNFRIVGRFFSE